MPSYKDDPNRSSDSLDHVEMQERDDEYLDDEEQLLSSPGEGEVDLKVESHLRTGWVILIAIIIALAMFFGLSLFTQICVSEKHTADVFEVDGPRDFRRPATDYILDPAWNFKAAKKVRKYQWRIEDIVANPDGVFRPMLAINGQFPGPMIECNEGDTLVIEVDNQSSNATSLHFHGIFQNGTNFMDGTTGITQCPIAPGRRFRYEFTVSGQSGTYYYHGHQGVQIADGLYGPLVVHSRDEKKLQKIPYASDRVVMLQDYYHDLSSGLLISALEPSSEASPIPDGALINGQNRYDCSSVPGRLCNNATATLPSFDLAANAHHRLRFINVGAFAWFQVSVDEHDFAVTEADGTDLLPANENSLMISPAQRYSMVLNTNQSTADSFWLRARMVSHCWKDPELPAAPANEVKAIIHYKSSSRSKKAKGVVAQPSSRSSDRAMAVQCRDMNSTSYVPASYEPSPAVADHSYYIRSNLEIGDWRLERGFFNTSTFRPQIQNPTLHRTVDGLRTANETFTSMAATDGVNSLSYDLKHDFTIQHAGIKTIDLIIQNFDEGNHPMHLHGHKFWVLGQGHGPFPGYASLNLSPEGRGLLPSAPQNALDNLLRRDVATAEGFGWVALRFVADNPGVWAFHCHMAWHSEAGLVMQFIDRVDEVAKWVVPEANEELCRVDVRELEKGAAPKDEVWFGDGVEGYAGEEGKKER